MHLAVIVSFGCYLPNCLVQRNCPSCRCAYDSENDGLRLDCIDRLAAL